MVPSGMVIDTATHPPILFATDVLATRERVLASHFYCGDGAEAARLAHNQKVGGASPSPATNLGRYAAKDAAPSVKRLPCAGQARYLDDPPCG